MTESRDRQVADALAAVRDAVERCRPLLADSGRHTVTALLGTACVTGEFTATMLYLVAPLADVSEPGTDEALERAADLAADSRRHIITGLHLIAGAQAITAAVVSLRRVTARPAGKRRWPGWTELRERAVRLWQEI